MNRELEEHALSIVLQLAESPAGDRDGLRNQLCGDDAPLSAAVADLWRAHEEAERKDLESPKVSVKSLAPATEKPKSKKLSFKELREFEAVEFRIAETEKRLPEIDIELAAAASDAGRVHELFIEQQKLNAKLEIDLSRWAELAERATE